MPELPEVETTARYLRKHVTGLKITGFWTDPKKPIKTGSGPGWNKIGNLLTGRRIDGVGRRAKYVVLHLAGGADVYVHQKMSGHLLYGDAVKCPADTCKSCREGTCRQDSCRAYIRAYLSLDNGHYISFCDQRRFGTMVVAMDGETHRYKELAKLGPEPLAIRLAEFKALFAAKRGYLKPVLMDPAFVAGIGNIYADEILWRSNLHPLSRVEALGGRDINNICRHARAILALAIRLGGSSTDDYRMPDGEKGGFQKLHQAYQRTGRPCSRKDGGVIERLMIGQRSAHFCSKHQKLVN